MATKAFESEIKRSNIFEKALAKNGKQHGWLFSFFTRLFCGKSVIAYLVCKGIWYLWFRGKLFWKSFLRYFSRRKSFCIFWGKSFLYFLRKNILGYSEEHHSHIFQGKLFLYSQRKFLKTYTPGLKIPLIFVIIFTGLSRSVGPTDTGVFSQKSSFSSHFFWIERGYFTQSFVVDFLSLKFKLFQFFIHFRIVCSLSTTSFEKAVLMWSLYIQIAKVQIVCSDRNTFLCALDFQSMVTRIRLEQ